MTLRGLCNRCGLCCMMGEYRCLNLILTDSPGKPRATQCGYYSKRYDGMPIVMVNGEGEMLAGEHVCRYESQEETNAILERGIGKGCSLEVISDV